MNGMATLQKEQKEGKEFWENAVEALVKSSEKYGLPFAYATAGKEAGFCAAMTNAYRSAAGMCLYGSECNNEGAKLFYRSEQEGLAVTLELSRHRGGGIRRVLEIQNIGDSDRILTMLSHRVTAGEYTAPLAQDTFAFGHCSNTWYGEGQWHFQKLEELGVFDEGGASPVCQFQITCASSQSTSRHFPNIYLLKKDKGCYYCELEPTGLWQISLALSRPCWGDQGYAVLLCGCAEDREMRFSHTLRRGEKYRSAACVCGFAKDLNGAIKAQTLARRESHKRLSTPRVCFNDYMNCIWANPDEETCLRLARRAKEMGADTYVDDDGWFVDKGVPTPRGLGEWGITSNRFSSGLKGFFEKVQSLGLTVGIWFEIEVCNEEVAKSLPSEWFVTYMGTRFGNPDRRFFNFTNPEVCRYLMEKIERVLAMGVRFIKNDYNDSYFAFGEEEVYGVEANRKAFLQFIDALSAKYPDLVIENCASGAMRSDGGILQHFALQSVSDQDDYRLYPSIIQGSLLNILPEKLGVWCMPRPVHVSGQSRDFGASFEELFSYSMVSSLTCLPYFGGRIDLCTEEEVERIREGVAIFKRLYPFVRSAVPEYIEGVPTLSKKEWSSLLLANEEGSEKLLYVWRMEGAPVRSFPLGKGWNVEFIFGTKGMQFLQTDEGIEITLPNVYTAAIFQIKRA